jgi:small-conductance mechanosensitive channel
MKQTFMKNWLYLLIRATKIPAVVILIGVSTLLFLKILQTVTKVNDYWDIALSVLNYFLIPIILLAVCWLSSRIINFKVIELRSDPQKTKTALVIILPIIRTGLILTALLISANFILPLLNLPGSYYTTAQKILNLMLVGALAWILIKCAFIMEQIVIAKRQHAIYGDWDTRSRQIYTKVHLLRQISVYFIAIIALAAALMLFDGVRKVGVGLFASAGIIATLVGFAAQKTLASFIGGLQIAFTQPLKIGDAVVIEKEFGNVEEITLTYIIVKLWDLRRLVLPINYFIDKPFENWSRSSRDLLGSVELFVDYHMPIETLRNKFQELLKQSKLWDGKVGVLQVTDCTENNLKIRLLISTPTAGDNWNLRCELREALINYIAHYQEKYLPKTLILAQPAPHHTNV